MSTSAHVADRAPAPAGRRELSRPQAFRFIGALLGLFLMASTAPSPMYAIYQRRWDFSTTVLTEVFAAYMVGILAALVLLGGTGILLENGVMQHMADIEAIHTYEGTESVQALLLGRDITGMSAFA